MRRDTVEADAFDYILSSLYSVLSHFLVHSLQLHFSITLTLFALLPFFSPSTQSPCSYYDASCISEYCPSRARFKSYAPLNLAVGHYAVPPSHRPHSLTDEPPCSGFRYYSATSRRDHILLRARGFKVVAPISRRAASSHLC